MSVSDKCSVLLSTEISLLWNKAVHGEAAAERLLGADIRQVSSHKQDLCNQKQCHDLKGQEAVLKIDGSVNHQPEPAHTLRQEGQWESWVLCTPSLQSLQERGKLSVMVEDRSVIITQGA